MAQTDILIVVLGALAVLVAYIAAASVIHLRRLRSVPIRVHVAGTRGKSSTVRLIAAGLRSGGFRVLAKCTGTQPCLIDLDGTELPWPRRGPVSIRELSRFFAQAARARAEVAVVESMAIRPELVAASERYFVQATTSVITNLRPDHFEELGSGTTAVTDGLLGVVPAQAELVLSDEAAAPAIIELARQKRTRTTIVKTTDLAPLDANRELALQVCESLGVSRESALQGMLSAPRDPGAFSVVQTNVGGKSIHFANAFSCNDVESFRLLWDSTYASPPEAAVVFLNIRHDRPMRTRQFIEFLATLPGRVELFLAADNRLVAATLKRLARRAGFPAGRISIVTKMEPATLLRRLAAASETESTVWGVGNFRGLGRTIQAQLEGEAA